MKELLFNLRKHDTIFDFYKLFDHYNQKGLIGVFSNKQLQSKTIFDFTKEEKILILNQYANNPYILSLLSKDQDYVIKTIACYYGSPLSFCLKDNCLFYPIFLIEMIFRNINFNINHLLHIYNCLKNNQKSPHFDQLFYKTINENILNYIILNKIPNQQLKKILKELCHSEIFSIRNLAFGILKRDYYKEEYDFIKKLQFEYNLDTCFLSPTDFYKIIKSEKREYILSLIAENKFLPKKYIFNLLSFKRNNINLSLASNKSLNFKQKQMLLEKFDLNITKTLLESLPISDQSIHFLDRMYYNFYKQKIRGSYHEKDFLASIIINKNTSNQVINDLFLNPLVNKNELKSSFIRNKYCPVQLLEEAAQTNQLKIIIDSHDFLTVNIISLIYNTLKNDINNNIIFNNNYRIIKMILQIIKYHNCPLYILWEIIQMNDIKDYYIDYYGDVTDGEKAYRDIIKTIKNHQNYLNPANALIKTIDALNI